MHHDVSILPFDANIDNNGQFVLVAKNSTVLFCIRMLYIRTMLATDHKHYACIHINVYNDYYGFLANDSHYFFKQFNVLIFLEKVNF